MEKIYASFLRTLFPISTHPVSSDAFFLSLSEEKAITAAVTPENWLFHWHELKQTLRGLRTFFFSAKVLDFFFAPLPCPKNLSCELKIFS